MPILPTLRRALLIALTLAAAAPVFVAAQPRLVVGTRVTLEPPAGFTPGERFVGFGREDAGASIVVTELHAPFRVMASRLTPEAFAAEGMVVRSADSLAVEGAGARLLSLTQDVPAGRFGKWVLMFGDDTVTTLVTATYPREAEAELGEPMKQAVLSARRGPPSADPLEGIGFHVDPGTRLRIAERMGNTLALNESGTLPNPEEGSPLLVVGLSLSEVDLSDVEAFSRRRVTQIGAMMEVAGITGGGPVSIGEAAGHELFADAVDRESATPIKVYQLVIPEGNHYLLVQGLVGADRADEFIPEFQAIARTLRRTP